ncbi:MAG: CBS domain-containing protein [Nocardioides sp.]
MIAADLAEPFPTVSLNTDALTAARTIGDARLPGLIVVDDDGSPHTVLGGSQVLRFMVPQYIQDDPALARVYDEEGSEKLLGRLESKTVHDLLPKKQDRDDLPAVDQDATTVEIAAVMAQMRSPVVAVLDADGRVDGAITVSRLFEHLFPGLPSGSADERPDNDEEDRTS